MTHQNREYISKFSWGASTILITVGVMALLLFLVVMTLNDYAPSPILKYVLAVVLVAPLVSALFFCPLYVKVTSSHVEITKPIGKVRIPLKEIISVNSIKFGNISDAIRTFGSGGFFGYVGYFMNPRYGNFLMYATQTKNLILIGSTKRYYVVTSSNPAGLLKVLKERTRSGDHTIQT